MTLSDAIEIIRDLVECEAEKLEESQTTEAELAIEYRKAWNTIEESIAVDV